MNYGRVDREVGSWDQEPGQAVSLRCSKMLPESERLNDVT